MRVSCWEIDLCSIGLLMYFEPQKLVADLDGPVKLIFRLVLRCFAEGYVCIIMWFFFGECRDFSILVIFDNCTPFYDSNLLPADTGWYSGWFETLQCF